MIDITQPPFNAVGDGLSDCTSAFLNAAKSYSEIVVPPGNYRVSPCLFRDLTSVSFRGTAGYASQILLGSPGNAFQFSNCQNLSIEGLAFTPIGTLPTSNGLLFDQGSSGNTVSRCRVRSFSKSGIRFIGDSASPLSGNEVADCQFLSNACEQLYALYNNDFWVEDNQFGITPSGAHAQVGAYMEHSAAGNYRANFHWNNIVGFKSVDGDYNRVCENRFEMSDHEGVTLDACDFLTFSDNTLHTNGLGAPNTYDQFVATGLTNSIVADNISLDWAGASHRYGYNIGSGCDQITFKGNRASGFATGPFVKVGTGAIDADEVIRGVSAAIAAGVTSYIGAAHGSSLEADVYVLIGARRVVAKLYVACVAAPGAGQSFTYTLRKNGADTAVTAAITGTSQWAAIDASHPITLADGDQIDVKLVTTAGAAVTQHRWKLDLVGY